jgi:hypothetical protein
VRGRAAVALSILLAAWMLALPGAALAAKHTAGSSSAKSSSSGSSSSGSGGAGLVTTSSTTNPITGGVGTPGTTPAATATATSTTPVGTSTSSSGSSLSGGDAIAIAAAALLVIGGIGLAIMRDARRRTPKGPVNDSIDRTPGSQRPPKPRKLSSAERKRRKRGRAPRRR